MEMEKYVKQILNVKVYDDRIMNYSFWKNYSKYFMDCNISITAY